MGRPFDLPTAPPLAEQRGDTYPALVRLMRRLLAADGCPWDRDQTIETLRRYVLEEACEVMDAIDTGDRRHLCEELGDLALQVVFLSELAQREGAFGHDDVLLGVTRKLVRRHPHVFSDGQAETPEEVELSWARIKAEEKKRRPLLDDIPRSLPALAGAVRVSERVAQVGFDWQDAAGSREKIGEELLELDESVQAGNRAEIEHEVGDLLLAVVNYARHLGIDPEASLRGTTDRFRRRFGHVESRVRARHGDWPREAGKPRAGLPLEELDGYWREAKELER